MREKIKEDPQRFSARIQARVEELRALVERITLLGPEDDEVRRCAKSSALI